MASPVWIVVLIKDFGTAKSRLASMLTPAMRRTLAVDNARLALQAAMQTGPTLAVCGSLEATEIATASGADVLLEDSPHGQNAAAALGIAEVAARGGASALIVSSDLPLVDSAALADLLTRAAAVAGPVAIAAAALGRQGTNALYLRPVDNFDLHFGDRSLSRFAAEARQRKRTFIAHHDPRLALDLDEPADVTMWERLREPA